MEATSSDRFERVRDSLLHLGLRQVTEEPAPGQPANLARRRATFKEHRLGLEDYRARRSAARVAAEEKIDSELRARLERINDITERNISFSARQAAMAAGLTDQASQQLVGSDGSVDARSSSGPANIVRLTTPGHNLGVSQPTSRTPDRAHSATMSSSTSATPVFAKENILALATVPETSSQSEPNPFADEPVHCTSSSIPSATNANLVDRTKPKRSNSRVYTASTGISFLESSSPENVVQIDFEETDVLHQNGSIAESPSPMPRQKYNLRVIRARLSHETGDPSRNRTVEPDIMMAAGRNSNELEQSRLDEQHRPDNTALDAMSAVTHPGCTRKHFRVRCITGRESIDGDTYYVVSWKSSWVPSDQIVTPAAGQERYIKIDGKDWSIAQTIKWKIKKGVPKELVRWIDDTLEPVKRLRRAIPAIREFELKPRLDRRIVSLDESLIDLTKILPQSEEEFRKAQVHLAKKWPVIEPRNDIDLLPAFRQIMMEIFPRPEDDNSNRKTHQRLIDMPQCRRLRWSEEYLLSGRFYEYTLPRRNALLLQAVAEVAENGCCERCVSDTAPFRECVRDTSEGSPWFNGGCANCGTAEANSTCCHHRVGTAHLEHGRSSGLHSERLRELIDPTRSVSLLSKLEYENDEDSDTYSADSYAESDNSSVYQPDPIDNGPHAGQTDFEDQDGDDFENNFWTPRSRSDDASTLAHARAAGTLVHESSGLFLTQSASPDTVGAPIGQPSLGRTVAASPVPTVTQEIRVATASGSSTRTLLNPFRDQTMSDYFDRSSSTLAAGGSAAKPTSQDTREHVVNDASSEPYQLCDRHDAYINDDSMGTRDLIAQDQLPSNDSSAGQIAAADSDLVVMQSVETFGQVPARPLGDHGEARRAHKQASSAEGRSRKRAASRPSAHERASNRPSTDSSRSSQSVSHDNAVSARSHRSIASPVSAVAESALETKIDRGHTHTGCRANRPCVHPDHIVPNTETMVVVYRDAISGSSSFTLDEVQYILSRCTCHWASAFAKVWNGWREESSTPEDAQLTKPQFLLTMWPEFLLEAAQECCPTSPANVVVITID